MSKRTFDEERRETGKPPGRENGNGQGDKTRPSPLDGAGERIVLLEIPLRHLDGVYATNRIDLHLTPREALGYRQLYDGLISRRATLGTGKYMGNQQVDAIRWLLGRIADAAGF